MIKANFNTYASYVTDSLYQWDINQELSISGLNISTAPEVHFVNANMDRAIVRQATLTNHIVKVAIPNSLLQEPLTIKAYIGIYEGDTFKVIELVEIPIKIRTRPSNYQIQDTDEEIYSFKALENKLENSLIELGKANAETNKLLSARLNTLISSRGLGETTVNLELRENVADEVKVDSMTITTNGIKATLLIKGLAGVLDYNYIAVLPEEFTPYGDWFTYDIPTGGKIYLSSQMIRIEGAPVTALDSPIDDIKIAYDLANPYIPELVDARLDNDGNVHDSTGTAVRNQINRISTGIDTANTFLDNQLRSYNLSNPNTFTGGYFLGTNDELITVDDTAFGYTDYIAVKPGEKIIARHVWGAQYSISCYDINKGFVSQQSYTEDTPIDGTNDSISSTYWYVFEIPQNIYYIRLNSKLTYDEKSMVVKGSTSEDIPTSYTPYNPEILAVEFLKAVLKYVENGIGFVNTEDNTILGYNALKVVDGIRDNVALGAYAMENVIVDTNVDDQSGRYNVAVGKSAMKETTTGNHNTACGFQALMSNTTGTANTAVGEDALMSISNGSNNVAIGCRALQSATEGDYNTAVGIGAGYWSDDNSPTGSRNTMIGSHSGQASGDGSDNVAIGYFAKATSGLNHTIAIGSCAKAEKDGQTVIGTENTVETKIYGDFVIRGSDGINRKIVFNEDNSVSWVIVD